MPLPAEASPLTLFSTPSPQIILQHHPLHSTASATQCLRPRRRAPLTLPLSPHTHSPQLIIHITPPLYHLHHAMPPQAEANPLTLPLSPSHPLTPINHPHHPPPLYRLHHAMPPPTEASPLAAKHPILHSCIFSVRV